MFLSGKRPAKLGVKNGRLGDGPNKPNWVCSQTEHKAHSIEPLPASGGCAAAMDRLKRLILGMPRTELIESGTDYLYFEFKTALMRYVDDVEFYCDGNVIHVRSASRLGYSDLNANRKRIEAIRDLFQG